MRKVKEFYFINRKYLITDDGEITRCSYEYDVIMHGTPSCVHRKECRIKSYIDQDGYANVKLICKGKKRLFKLHHLVYMIFVNNMNYIDENSNIGYDFSSKNFLQINHIDGNKLNNYYKNLELVSLQENIHHAVITGIHNSQMIKKTIMIYKDDILVKEVDTVRGASKYLLSVGTNIDGGSICRLVRSGKTRKGYSFKYKSNDYRKESF